MMLRILVLLSLALEVFAQTERIPVEMYQSIPHAHLWIVPNGGHVPIGEHAGEFTRTTLEFLKPGEESK